MKKMFILGFTLISLNAFSQSHMVLHNGITLTTDKAGFVYDFGHFNLPYKVNFSGGQWLVYDYKLATVDEKGFFYRKNIKVEEIKGKGLNYFITDDEELFTIDSKGFAFKFKDKAAFKEAFSFGGKFFLSNLDKKKKTADLFTISSNGTYSKLIVPGLNPLDIITLGGNYFMTSKGVAYTISNTGLVFAKSTEKIDNIKKMGGNFFIDASNKLWTVSEEGLLTLPVLPTTLNISMLKKLGANFMIDYDGKIFTVDTAGNVVEIEVKSHDLRNVKVVSF